MAQIRIFPAKILTVIDGDTVVASLDLGFELSKSPTHMRLAGIDAPEKMTEPGVKVKHWLEVRIAEAEMKKDSVEVRTLTHHEDKYGRILGDLLLGGKSVSEEMLLLGLVRPYDGGKKLPWPVG